jgi:hypothetical protein
MHGVIKSGGLGFAASLTRQFINILIIERKRERDGGATANGDSFAVVFKI